MINLLEQASSENSNELVKALLTFVVVGGGFSGVETVCSKSTNTYIYLDNGTTCFGEPNKDFELNTWVENPGTNRNFSLPLNSNSSGNLTVNQFGTYTADFKPQTQITIPSDFLYGVVLGPTVGAVLGGLESDGV